MQVRNTIALSLSFACLLGLSSVCQADHHETVKAKVSDLAWMTGSWAGSMGPQTLEENWSKPADGTIAATVRMRGDGRTGMFEVVYIEEEGDSLALFIQQWNPGFQSRADAQKMTLASIGDQKVSFTAVEKGVGLDQLTYTRVSDDLFTIDVKSAQGAFQIKLNAN